MFTILIKIFFITFFINLLYELLHSLLYKTCEEASLKKYIYLIIKGAVFDGISIVLIYFLSFLIFKAQNIFENYFQLFFFFIISIIFAYLWEIYSLKSGKWQYTESMPKLFGSGITPLIQLALTGILTFFVLLL